MLSEWWDRVWCFWWDLRMLYDVGVPVRRLLAAHRAHWQLHRAHGLDPCGVQRGPFDEEAWRTDYDGFLSEWSPAVRERLARARGTAARCR